MASAMNFIPHHNKLIFIDKAQCIAEYKNDTRIVLQAFSVLDGVFGGYTG
jgi:hypothetical protein